MRIAYIVPGTGGSFYCENCIRDCAMITGLRALGHEVTAVPMYLPLMHEENVALGDAPLFFGAVRIYLRERFPVLELMPGRLLALLDSPALLSIAAAKAGSTRAGGHERMTLSMLEGIDGPVADEFERLVRWVRRRVEPDAVFLSNAFLLGVARSFKAFGNVPVACMVQDEHTWVDACAPAFHDTMWKAIARQSAHADVLLSVSRWYGARVRTLTSLPAHRIEAIPFGVDPSRYNASSPAGHGHTLGYLSRLSREGGLPDLTRAYTRVMRGGRVPALSLALCGGATRDDAGLIDTCTRMANEAGPVRRHRGFGLSVRQELLASLSVLSVPMPGEIALGVFIVEALAAGVPVVQPDRGGFSEIVTETGGGVLYSPATPEALAEALESLLCDQEKRHRLARRGREAVRDRFNHLTMAQAALDALSRRSRPDTRNP